MKLIYEEHQRDYTLLGNSATFTFCMSKELKKYFRTSPSPMYVCKKDNLFFHYYTINDMKRRAQNWNNLYSINDLKSLKIKLELDLVEIRKKFEFKNNDIETKILEVLSCYKKILIASLVSTEVPEFIKVSKKFLNISFEMRKEMEFVFKQGESLVKKLTEKLARQHKKPKNFFQNMTYQEFLSFVNSKKIPTHILYRDRFVFVKITPQGELISYAKKAINVLSLNQPQKTIMIKGNIAFRGLVTGKVKIIKLISDASKIKKRDILVSSMTDPRYLPAMKKAVAFVTDEGGITCHAAIVARELKKPCIIGTKIATKVLKDGDLVEVDAERGVVKIIERK